jgi:hypothetical protein
LGSTGNDAVFGDVWETEKEIPAEWYLASMLAICGEVAGSLI